MRSFFKFIGRILLSMTLLALFGVYFVIMLLFYFAELIADTIAYRSDVKYRGDFEAGDRRTDRRSTRDHKLIDRLAAFWQAILNVWISDQTNL